MMAPGAVGSLPGAPFGITGVPPWGVSGPPPATYSGQPTGPNGQPVRPMFPSAAGPNGPASSGAESYKATFPAYSEAKDQNKPVAMIATTSASSKIMHPPEDISLEEHRAKLRKYQPPSTSIVSSINSGQATPASTPGGHLAPSILPAVSMPMNAGVIGHNIPGMAIPGMLPPHAATMGLPIAGIPTAGQGLMMQ